MKNWLSFALLAFRAYRGDPEAAVEVLTKVKEKVAK